MKRSFCLIVVIVIVSLLCAGCGQQSRQTFFAMDTVIDLQVWGKDAQRAVSQLQKILTEQERIWSATDPVSPLNTGSADPAVLSRVEELCVRTHGAFDPHLGAVIRAWGFYNKRYRVPTQEEITTAQKDPQWDLGAAVKGYAGDLCVAVLEGMNVDRGILNLGGNVQTFGEKPDGSPWTVGIQNPEGGDYIGTVAVSGTMAVVTSGDYQRYFEADGVRYHHIIDPETGMPARSGLRSVTVICYDGLTADALSTAIFVMGLDDGMEFWRTSDDFEAVFITDEGKVYATDGADLSGCEFEVICREN